MNHDIKVREPLLPRPIFTKREKLCLATGFWFGVTAATAFVAFMLQGGGL